VYSKGPKPRNFTLEVLDIALPKREADSSIGTPIHSLAFETNMFQTTEEL